MRDDGGVKVFLSSVRRGLEEERGALPGLIIAVGHEVVRFEDFTAQSQPSREACLAGLATVDAYLLLLGPNYGHRFEDTGQSPTHDEWVAATVAGIPRVVYRKLGVDFEPEQEELARSIGDYTSGVFYDSFTTTPELLTKVAGKLRELAQAGDPLTFSPLTRPVTVTRRADFDAQLRGGSSSGSALEVHVVPLDAQPRSTRLMSELATVLPNRIRESGLVTASEALPVSRPQDAVMVSVPIPRAIWNAPRDSACVWTRTARSQSGLACQGTGWVQSSTPTRCENSSPGC
jgi:Domain of unknown function (DUF4062)